MGSSAVFRCGCSATRSMDCDDGHDIITGVTVCFKHSMDDRMHAALKTLYEVAGSTRPVNYDEPTVQVALSTVADLIFAS